MQIDNPCFLPIFDLHFAVFKELLFRVIIYQRGQNEFQTFQLEINLGTHLRPNYYPSLN